MSGIYEQWNDFQNENDVPAEQREAVVIPRLILEANDLPPEMREAVERLWDRQFRLALEMTERIARVMAEGWL